MGVQLPNYISGEYAVGTECFTVVDETRMEVLGPATGQRKMSVRMYYPVEKSAIVGKKRADIFTQRKIEALQKAYFLKVKDEEMLKADYYEEMPHVEKKFPLVIYNHGYNSYAEANTFLCCELASNGYVVAAIGHAHEAIANEYEDGTYDLYDKKINKMLYDSVIKTVLDQNKLLNEKGTPEELFEKFDVFQKKHCTYLMGRVVEWAKDTMCVVTHLKTRYEKWIDFSNGIGVTGHSMGGATAYYLCQHEEEVTCGINIDGGLFGEWDGLTMKKPFLQMCCKENYNVETKPLFGTDAPVELEIFENLKHIGFTDAKFFIPVKMLVGRMDALEMYERLSTCHLKFLEKYLKNV